MYKTYKTIILYIYFLTFKTDIKWTILNEGALGCKLMYPEAKVILISRATVTQTGSLRVR